MLIIVIGVTLGMLLCYGALYLAEAIGEGIINPLVAYGAFAAIVLVGIAIAAIKKLRG